MDNEKQLIRWEKHYSDGSVEYTDEQSTKNFIDNLSCADGLIVSRSYIKMKPVNWHTREQNLNKHLVMQAACQHEIVDATNEVIQSGYLCVKCNAIFKAAAVGQRSVAQMQRAGMRKCTCPDDQCLLGDHTICRWKEYYVGKSSEGHL